MHRVECDYCGLPFKVRRVDAAEKVYCCAGCALADRVRSSADEFPVTPELVLALLAGFAAFNQLLGALMHWLYLAEGRVDLAEKFWWGAMIAGSIAWLLAVVAQMRSGARRGIDLTVAGAAIGLLVIGTISGSAVCGIVGTVGFLAWCARGWMRKRRE